MSTGASDDTRVTISMSATAYTVGVHLGGLKRPRSSRS
ncbi:hypothetical protein BH24ACT17_BH24ACT17_17140 [soil metagenome]